jgi:hypothetical protein
MVCGRFQHSGNPPYSQLCRMAGGSRKLKETNMTINLRDKRTVRLLGSAFALAMSVSPLVLTFDQGGLHLGGQAAFAKDGSSGSSGSGGGGSGGGSSGSGSGRGDSGGDHSGRGGEHSGGSSGRGDSGGNHSDRGGGDDHGGGDSGGRGRGGNDDGPNHHAGDDNGRRGAEHIGRNGAKVEINGNNVEVVHASGIKEEVENGRYELKDAAGRTIVERRATARDVARLTNTAR